MSHSTVDPVPANQLPHRIVELLQKAQPSDEVRILLDKLRKLMHAANPELGAEHMKIYDERIQRSCVALSDDLAAALRSGARNALKDEDFAAWEYLLASVERNPGMISRMYAAIEQARTDFMAVSPIALHHEAAQQMFGFLAEAASSKSEN